MPVRRCKSARPAKGIIYLFFASNSSYLVRRSVSAADCKATPALARRVRTAAGGPEACGSQRAVPSEQLALMSCPCDRAAMLGSRRSLAAGEVTGYFEHVVKIECLSVRV